MSLSGKPLVTKKNAVREPQTRHPQQDLAWSEFTLQDVHRLKAIYLLLGADERLLEFLFDRFSARLRAEPGQLMREVGVFSYGEQLLIRAAMDVWSGSGAITLGQLLDTWDDQCWLQLIRAICHLKELRRDAIHALLDDDEVSIP